MNKPVFKTTSKRSTPPGQTLSLGTGESVFEEGEIGTEMYIINEGRVEILKRVQGEERQLAVLEKGDFFGEMALLEDLPRSAAARTLTEVKLVTINGSTFDQMLRANPEIAVRMMRKLSRRLRETDQQLQAALGKPEAIGLLEIPSPQPAGESAVGPQRFFHELSGSEFLLAEGPESLIGRRDPVTGIHPDIDLGPVDGQRSTSRRHAKVLRKGERFFVVEEIGTMNGTYLNGSRIETGTPVEIRHGDELRFGVVNLRFLCE
ncbi:MAG: cyclic nucleotide-binding domain-containing protein [Acidobacteria bacterium]|nr:cyclic nucleotide-binding domain-containing protein [Acidobacteriota bacterium]